MIKNKNKKNKNIFISINNDLANLYIEENYTNVNIAIMVISIRVPGKKRYTYYVHVSEDNLKVCTSLSLSYTQIACNSAMCIICNHFCKYTSPDR